MMLGLAFAPVLLTGMVLLFLLKLFVAVFPSIAMLVIRAICLACTVVAWFFLVILGAIFNPRGRTM